MLRISEIYRSVQGEGPRVGSPTIFIRFGGCNLRCPGWPCDTQHAIDPKYRNEWKQIDAEEVSATAVDLAGGTPERVSRYNICFTGGEPFLQNNDRLLELCNKLRNKGFRTMEVFTNGTLEFPDWSLEWLYFIMDWKLPSSGESQVNLDNRRNNYHKLSENDALKFTIADRADFEAALGVYNALFVDENNQKPYWYLPKVYAGVVWGKLDNATLVEWMQQYHASWRLNVQLHNHIWDREKRGI